MSRSCLLQSLCERLGSKEIWVDGSDRYWNPERPAHVDERRSACYERLSERRDGNDVGVGRGLDSCPRVDVDAGREGDRQPNHAGGRGAKLRCKYEWVTDSPSSPHNPRRQSFSCARKSADRTASSRSIGKPSHSRTTTTIAISTVTSVAERRYRPARARCDTPRS